ncbi:MAG: hypothetical protein PVH77_01220 [Phycisphaerales bacterium]|jgi:hypothetical protein
MNTKKSLLVVAAVLMCCIIVAWFSTSTQGEQKTYEIQPQITVPEYRTDAARAIDAYERLMERYMNQTERNSRLFNVAVKDINKKLNSIDYKLTKLSVQIGRIEKTLGIKQPKPAANEQTQPKASDKKTSKKSLTPK